MDGQKAALVPLMVAIMKKAKWVAREYQLYEGRQRLGRYVHTARGRYQAFNVLGRLLGKFRSRAKSLTAIRGARSDLA